MISIKKNRTPILPKCKFLCDGKLDDKLDEYELTRFLNCHSTTLFIGKPRSGKTSLLYSLFKSKKLLRKCFENIFLFQPSHSRASMKDKLFDQLDDNKKFDELTYENLKYVVDTIKYEVEEENINNCIIFDDMGAYLRDHQVKQLLKELVMNRRHLHTSIFFLCQTYKSLEPDIRKLFSNIFLFKVSKKEMENIMDEIIESYNKNNIDEIIKLVYDKPFNFLFINTDTQTLFKNWDQILISDNI